MNSPAHSAPRPTNGWPAAERRALVAALAELLLWDLRTPSPTPAETVAPPVHSRRP